MVILNLEPFDVIRMVWRTFYGRLMAVSQNSGPPNPLFSSSWYDFNHWDPCFLDFGDNFLIRDSTFAWGPMSKWFPFPGILTFCWHHKPRSSMTLANGRFTGKFWPKSWSASPMARAYSGKVKVWCCFVQGLGLDFCFNVCVACTYIYIYIYINVNNQWNI